MGRARPALILWMLFSGSICGYIIGAYWHMSHVGIQW